MELQPDEVLVQARPAAGLAIAAERGAVVAVSTALTSELRAEGLAREVVRRVQAMRKDAGFNIEDRIVLYYDATGAVAEVMAVWNGYIRSETLSTALVPGPAPAGAYVETHDVDGEQIVLAVRRATGDQSL